jgi:gluconokinase
MTRGTSRPAIVVMGVAGVGKSTVARLLAERLGLPFMEGDDLHSADNVAKMSAGIPLDDQDRWPWLAAISDWLRECDAAGTGGVVTCSAVRRGYRDVLRVASPEVFFVHLSGDRALVGERMARRTGHFMPPELLDSQYAALEPLAPDELGTVLDVRPDAAELVEAALAALAAR